MENITLNVVNNNINNNNIINNNNNNNLDLPVFYNQN